MEAILAIIFIIIIFYLFVILPVKKEEKALKKRNEEYMHEQYEKAKKEVIKVKYSNRKIYDGVYIHAVNEKVKKGDIVEIIIPAINFHNKGIVIKENYIMQYGEWKEERSRNICYAFIISINGVYVPKAIEEYKKYIENINYTKYNQIKKDNKSLSNNTVSNKKYNKNLYVNVIENNKFYKIEKKKFNSKKYKCYVDIRFKSKNNEIFTYLCEEDNKYKLGEKFTTKAGEEFVIFTENYYSNIKNIDIYIEDIINQE